MRTPSVKSLAIALLLAPATLAFARARTPLELLPESRLWVEGTSNVRSFSCAAKSFTTDVQTPAADAVAQVLAGEKAVGAVDVKVDVAQLDCANGKMNDHMRKTLKAQDNPTIEFVLGSYELVKADSGMQAKLDGTLTLAGTPKPVTITADVTQASEGVLHVTGSYGFRLTDFGLKPPSLMLGAFKVHDPVTVRFDLFLHN